MRVTVGHGPYSFCRRVNVGYRAYSSCRPASPRWEYVICSNILILLQVCLELVIAVALRNRDRILLIWPLVHDYLAAIMAPEGTRQARWAFARITIVKILPQIPHVCCKDSLCWSCCRPGQVSTALILEL